MHSAWGRRTLNLWGDVENCLSKYSENVDTQWVWKQLNAGLKGPMANSDSQPLYPYADQFGQVAWSHIPPSEADIQRQPFYHEPMRVEEAKPPPLPTPVGVSRSGSLSQRQVCSSAIN